jgi:hypothetical protein
VLLKQYEDALAERDGHLNNLKGINNMNFNPSGDSKLIAADADDRFSVELLATTPGNIGNGQVKDLPDQINPNAGVIELAPGVKLVSLKGSDYWSLQVDKEAIGATLSLFIMGNHDGGEVVNITFNEAGEFTNFMGNDEGHNHVRVLGFVPVEPQLDDLIKNELELMEAYHKEVLDNEYVVSELVAPTKFEGSKPEKPSIDPISFELDYSGVELDLVGLNVLVEPPTAPPTNPPSDPTNPTNPTNPSDPGEPEEPTEPDDEDPTNPTPTGSRNNPSDPIEPTPETYLDFSDNTPLASAVDSIFFEESPIPQTALEAPQLPEEVISLEFSEIIPLAQMPNTGVQSMSIVWIVSLGLALIAAAYTFISIRKVRSY